MRPRYVLVLILSLFPFLSAAAAEAPPSDTMIFLVDRSASIARLPEPDTIQACLTHIIKVAALSNRPVNMAVIFFNGNDVTVVAGKDGLPTAAHQTLLHRIVTDWPKAEGGTPLDKALAECVRMVQTLPADTSVTVVHFGDGDPASGRIRPEDFPAVGELMEKQRQEIASNTRYPEAIKQGLLEQLKREWLDPRSPAGKRLHELQIQAEFDACLQHTATLATRDIRFVSVDFANNERLRQLHDAAGGMEDDYLVALQVNTVSLLHKAGITAFGGVVLPKPAEFPAVSHTFETTYPIELGQLGEAAVVSIVFERPIEEFRNHVELNIETASTSFRFDSDNSDPAAILSCDGTGRVATATLSLPAIPRDGRLTIQYRSPSATRSIPALTVYVHQRLREDLKADLRPAHVPVDQDSPYSVAPTQPIRWTFALRAAQDHKPYPLASVEAILRRQDGDTTRLDFQQDPDAPGAFLTPIEHQLDLGTYTCELHCVSPTGIHFSLELADHIDSRVQDEHVTLQIGEGSSSKEEIKLGDLGDDVVEGTVSLQVRSANVDYPLNVEAKIVDLIDCRGTPLPLNMFQLSRAELLLQPGRPTPLIIRWKLPDRLDSVEDGTVTATVAFFRGDTNQSLDVRSYLDGDQAFEPINGISFTLRRPGILTSCPRGWRTEFEADSRNLHARPLNIPIQLWTPCSRSIAFRVEHTSILDREVHATLDLPFRSKDGRAWRSITITPTRNQLTTQQLGPNAIGMWDYCLEIPRDAELSEAFGSVVFLGPGLRPLEVPIQISVRHPLLGPKVRLALWFLLALAAVAAIAAAIRLRNLLPYASGRAIEIREDEPFEFLSVKTNRSGQAELVVDDRNVRQRRLADTNFQTAKRSQTLTDIGVNPGSQLLFAKQADDDDVPLTIQVERVSLVDGNPVVEASIYDPGHYGEDAAESRRKLMVRSVTATLILLLALSLFHPTIVSAAQWLLDMF